MRGARRTSAARSRHLGGGGSCCPGMNWTVDTAGNAGRTTTSMTSTDDSQTLG
jgi:hypothetical protein